MAERYEWVAPSRDPQGAVSDDKRVEALQRRLEKLEKENRGWGLIIATLIGGLALVIFIVAKAARPVDELRVGRLVLVDKSGQPRGILSVGDGNAPSLVMLDRSRRARVIVGMTPEDQPQLVLAGANEQPRIRVSLDGDTGALVQFADRSGAARAWVGVGRTGASGIWVHGTDGREYASLTGGSNYFSALSFLGRSGKERAALGMNAERALLLLTGGSADTSAAMAIAADGLPGLTLNDRDRGAQVKLQMQSDGTPLLTLKDKKGQAAAISSPRILLGKDQAVLWAAP